MAAGAAAAPSVRRGRRSHDGALLARDGCDNMFGVLALPRLLEAAERATDCYRTLDGRAACSPRSACSRSGVGIAATWPVRRRRAKRQRP